MSVRQRVSACQHDRDCDPVGDDCHPVRLSFLHTVLQVHSSCSRSDATAEDASSICQGGHRTYHSLSPCNMLKRLFKSRFRTSTVNNERSFQHALLCRGPGDFLGKKQSGRDGLSCLKAARLPEDRQLLEQARAAAAELLQEYGLEPSGWPQDLLAALKDKNLPDLDLSEVSQLTWGGDKGIEAAMAAGK